MLVRVKYYFAGSIYTIESPDSRLITKAFQNDDLLRDYAESEKYGKRNLISKVL